MVTGGINFPVAGDTPGINGTRPERDRNTLRDMASGMPARNKAAVHTFAVALWKKRNQESSVAVDPLIDGFVTDGAAGQIKRNTASDQFRRPAQTEFGFHVVAKR